MPRGFHPVLLILALASPASVGALGLGEIHVDSALNEPLSAQIDIVGASLDDLTELRAAIASLETFQRYNAERPGYLNSATFKIGRDVQGRPVLDVRSRESFTDPLVSFLVDLKWRNSELVREYSLLLDPSGLSASRRAAAIAAVASAVIAPPASIITASPAVIAPPASIITASPAVIAPPAQRLVTAHDSDSGSHHRITSRDTLRGIVRHAGARSETQVQRMMIATFRANPGAFEGNINRLHRGVVLNFPPSADVNAISPADAKRDVDQQMTEWRSHGRYAAASATPATNAKTFVRASVPLPLPAPVPVPVAMPMPSSNAVAREASDSTLTDRLRSLEQELVDLHRQMAKESANIQELKQAAGRPTPSPPSPQSAATPPAVVGAELARPQTPSKNLNTLLGLAALLLGAALAVYSYLRSRMRRPAPLVEIPAAAATAADEPAAPTILTAEAVAPAQEASPPAFNAPPPPRQAAPAGSPQWPPVAERNSGMAVEVDTEALERSYLESLGFNTSMLGKNAATGESGLAEGPADSAEATVEIVGPEAGSPTVTAEIDMSEVDDTETLAGAVNTAVLKVDATTLVVAVPPAPTRAPAVDTAATATTDLDFNLSDLDATAQHVQMPSALNDHVEVSEGRTNIVDVLKMAIDRDPHRRDLRMKLVETYYNAAAGNRKAFLEVVRKLAREREYMSAEEWSKIVRMGRDLAPDDILFTDLVKDEDDVAA